MVHFENRAWQMLAKFEMAAGFWPFQSRIKNYTTRIGILIIILTYNIPLVLGITKARDFYILLENSLVISIILVVTTKILSASLQQNQRRKILELVASHFETIVDEEESKILRNHSNKGFKLIITFTVLAVGGCGLFDGIPIMRMYFLYFFKNGNLQKKCPLHVDYLVDEQKYFYYILVHLFFSLGIGMIAEFSYDFSFFLTVRHACALFEIIGLRLKRASEIYELSITKKNQKDCSEDKAYKLISSAVDLHVEALQLAGLLDEAYNVSWFVVLLLNMSFLAPVVLTVLFYMNNPLELSRYFVALIILLAHFYVTFLQGQLMIDYSSSVFTACYNTGGYNVPKKARVAISIIMKNSLVPCEITGGRMFILSMETYGKMLKTGLSFISLFAALEY